MANTIPRYLSPSASPVQPVGSINFSGQLGTLPKPAPQLPSPVVPVNAGSIGVAGVAPTPPQSSGFMPSTSDVSALTNSSNFMQAGAAVGNMVAPGVGGLVGAGVGGAADMAMAAYNKARQEEELDRQMAEARAVQIAQQRRADRQYADQQFASAIMRGDAKELQKYNRRNERSQTFKAIVQGIYAQRQAMKAAV